MSRALAVDLGGTNIRAGLAAAEDAGAMEPLGQWPAPRSREALKDLVGGLLAQHEVRRVGIAIPGLALGTTCQWVPNLGYLDRVDLAALFPSASIALGNDAHFALLAEARAGAAWGLSDAILLAVGTGIGTAVMSGRRILRGAYGGAASFGWACADLDDPGSERHGWLERTASGPALDRLAQEAGLGDGAALVERARRGHDDAVRLLARPARAIGVSAAGAVALLDTKAVVLTGGTVSALDVMGDEIGAAMRRHLPPHMRGVQLVPGSFGAGASLAGAGIAAFKGESWEHVA